MLIFLREPKSQNTDIHLLEFVGWKALISAGSLISKEGPSGITTKFAGERRLLRLYDYDVVTSVTDSLLSLLKQIINKQFKKTLVFSLELGFLPSIECSHHSTYEFYHILHTKFCDLFDSNMLWH